MARPAAEHPTELELRILKVLWERAPLPVRDVRQGLADGGRKLAHTSVITTLNTMVAKGYLRRTMDGNACLFAPRVSREAVSRRMLSDVVARVFDGSTKAVLLSLFESAELNPEDLQELRRLINRKAKE
jgi:predicted transcriptional regulator